MHIHYASITVCRFSATLILKWNISGGGGGGGGGDDEGLRRGEGICHHPYQRHVMGIYSLSVLKTVHAWWRITSYKRWPCWLTEHGRSKGVNLKKKSPSPRCTLPCWGTTDAFAVEGKKPRTVNCETWQPTVSSSLTAAGRAISQWTEDIPSYLWCSDGD